MRLAAFVSAIGCALFALTGCRADDAAAPSAPAFEPGTCVDGDLDGFGVGCARGADCDDASPLVTNECYRCQNPGYEGCPCEAEGATTKCGMLESVAASAVTCGYGGATCVGGKWSACAVDRTATQRIRTGGSAPLGLDAAVACNIPCDPWCSNFPNDTPEGLDDGGLVATEAGLTLLAVDAGAPPPPDGGDAGGDAATVQTCNGLGEGTCAHPTCANGAALPEFCDISESACATPTWPSAPRPLVEVGTVTYDVDLTPSCSVGFVCTLDATVTCCAYDSCPPAAFPTYTYTNVGASTCEDRSCGACAAGTQCRGAEPNVTCCSPSSCTAQVCATSGYAYCCSSDWDQACVRLASSLCAACGDLDLDGDPDVDDCAQCDPLVNHGAFDFPDDGVDNDCSDGIASTLPTCDATLALDSASPLEYAKALDLCPTTTSSSTLGATTWGVLTDGANAPALTVADGARAATAPAFGILPAFGTSSYNQPRRGASMVALGTGAARAISDPDFASPQIGLERAADADASSLPQGYPASATNDPGCGASAHGTSFHDTVALAMAVRVPTNAQGYSFRSQWFTADYPEWTCSSSNDAFVALVDGSLVPSASPSFGNVLFGPSDVPVTVNLVGVPAQQTSAFFPIPGAAAYDHPYLAGTGYGGFCGNSLGGTNQYAYRRTVCGGSTGWLTTTVPAAAGETVRPTFALWDSGDERFDSLALIDDWRWLPKAASTTPIATSSDPSVPPAPTYVPSATFVRDYDSACQPGYAPTWLAWTWTSFTPADSDVQFEVATAATEAALAHQTLEPLYFTSSADDSFPTVLDGQPAHARASYSGVDTESGSVSIDASLDLNGQLKYGRYLRVRATLSASTDFTAAPLLSFWNVTYDCLPAQ